MLSILKEALKSQEIVIYVQSGQSRAGGGFGGQEEQEQHCHIPKQLWAKESNYGPHSSLDIDGLSLDMSTFEEAVYLSSLQGLEFSEESNQQGTLYMYIKQEYQSPWYQCNQVFQGVGYYIKVLSLLGYFSLPENLES